MNIKQTKYWCPALLAALAVSLGACSNNDDDEPASGAVDVTKVGVVTFEEKAMGFKSNGMWNDCYATEPVGQLDFYNVNFSHSATYWADYDFYSWGGFCPSNSNDKSDHSDDWLSWQWSNTAGTGWSESTGSWIRGGVFLTAFWDTQESTSSLPAKPALRITATANLPYLDASEEPITPAGAPSRTGEMSTFQPKVLRVVNSTYTYYNMVNGSDYNEPFGTDDWLKITAIGVCNGQETGRSEFYLAKDGNYVTDWTAWDLSDLGSVQYFYLQMSSSQTGAYGMNVPAYFCVGSFSLIND